MNKIIKLFPLVALLSTGLSGCSNKNTVFIFTAHEENRIQLFNKELKEHFPNYNIQIVSKTTGALMSELQAQGTRSTCDIFVGIEITNAEILLNFSMEAGMSRMTQERPSLLCMPAMKSKTTLLRFIRSPSFTKGS